MNNFLQFLGIVKKSHNAIEGYNKCEEALKLGNIKLLIITCDCSLNTKKKFSKYCDNKHIPLIECFDSEVLGRVLGKEKISIVGISDIDMSKKLEELWQENSSI